MRPSPPLPQLARPPMPFTPSPACAPPHARAPKRPLPTLALTNAAVPPFCLCEFKSDRTNGILVPSVSVTEKPYQDNACCFDTPLFRSASGTFGAEVLTYDHFSLTGIPRISQHLMPLSSTGPTLGVLKPCNDPAQQGRSVSKHTAERAPTAWMVWLLWRCPCLLQGTQQAESRKHEWCGASLAVA